MGLQDSTNSFLQNKNIVMFIVTFTFILGVIAFYNGTDILFATLISSGLIILLLRRIIPPKFALIVIFMFYFGFFNSSLRIKDFDEISTLAPAEVTLTGQIVSIPEINGQTCKFYAKFNEPKGKVLIWVNDKQHEFTDFELGNSFQITGRLKRPQEATNPSQFNYAKYLQNHKTYSIMYAKAKDCIFLEQKLSPKWIFLRKLNNLRGKILDIHRNYLKSPNLEILGGIVFGDDAVSPPEHIKSSFINSGLLHILAASGMNVAFIWGFWFFLMRKFKVEYRITLISGIVLIILYTLMTGLGASVVRASLMLTFVLIGKLIDRDTHSVSLLSFVALLMLLYNPAYLNDIGFQMSFVATLGILTMGQALHQRLETIKIPEVIKGDVTIPIIAQGWVAPTQMFYFNTFAPYSILANIAIIPFLCVISFGGFLSSILAIFYPLTKYLCQIIDFILNLFITIIINISNFFSSIPHSLITTQKPTILAIILYYVLLGLITYAIKTQFTKKLLITTLSFILIICLTFINIPNNKLEILTFDVQNADCFLIKTPQNNYYIIDTGKFSYTSQNPQASMTIGKFLKDNGIRKIKGLIITHFDNDHAGGGAYILNNFKVETVYINSSERKSITAQKLFDAIEITNTPFEISPIEKTIQEKDLTIKLLRSDIQDNDNENSIQTVITYKDFEILFMGDAGIKGYDAIKTKLPNNIDILKVGHHGAKNVTNEEMLNKLVPKFAIISTGQNTFGHPSKQTLENLKEQNVKILRTDYDHSIKIQTNGEKIKTFTFNSTKKRFDKSKP